MLLLAFNSFEKPNRLQLYAKANPNTSKLSNDPSIGLKMIRFDPKVLSPEVTPYKGFNELE